MAPLDPNLVSCRPALRPIIPEVVREDEPKDEAEDDGRTHWERFREKYRFQFTIADLFKLTTATAVLLAIMKIMAGYWQYAAGLAGIGALVCLIIITVAEPERRIVQVIWWTMLALYVLASLAAFVTAMITG